jgi:predicted permease
MTDLKFAIRSLSKSPMFAVICVVTLALGIGLNTSMFSFTNALMLRPLPFPDSDRLVRLYQKTPADQYGAFSYGDYAELKRVGKEFGSFAAFQSTSMTLDGEGRTISRILASDDLFEVLKINPILGRIFRKGDDLPGNGRVTVISYDFWRSNFGGASNVVGQTVRGNGETYEVVGVLPQDATDHRLFERASLFCPLVTGSGERGDRNIHQLTVLGRRSADVTEGKGEAIIRSVGERLAREFPRENANSEWRIEGLPVQTISPTGKAMLIMLLCLSGCVLAVACFNLANLLIARTMERNRELATRSALGASLLDLIRPLVFELAILVSIGSAGALIVANWTTDWLNSVILNGGGPALGFPMDWRVLSFAIGVSALTILFFGIGPAVFVRRMDVNDVINGGARGATSHRSHWRLRNFLIIGQFAFALILLAGAGFFLRGADGLMKQSHGWSSDHVLHGELQLPTERHSNDAAIVNFQRSLIDRIEKLSGVDSVSVSYGLPYLGLRGADYYVAAGRDEASPGQRPLVRINGITPDYFKVTGTPLILGRGFNDADTAKSERVAIINDAMARANWGDENPIGKRISSAESEPREWMEVVGVVGSVSPVDFGQAAEKFQLYQPASQDPRSECVLALRTSAINPESLARAVRASVADLNPDVLLNDLTTADHSIELLTSQMYLCRQLLSAFALLGLLLATLGVYGVMARIVIQRTSEIGIRIALGASVKNVVSLVLGSGIRIAVIGSAIGFLGGVGLERIFASMLPSMETGGYMVLGGATTLLLIAALFASWLPALRATRVDPLVALKTN